MRFIVRADNGPKAGNGHIMRCSRIMSALIAYAKKGDEGIFVVRHAISDNFMKEMPLWTQVRVIGCEVGSEEDVKRTREIATAGSMLLIDGYRFPSDYYRRFPEACVVAYTEGFSSAFPGPKISIDGDTITSYHHSSSTTGTHALGGLRYFPMGSGFKSCHMDSVEKVAPEQVSRILVSLGGTRYAREAERAVAVMAKNVYPNAEVLVVGACEGAVPHVDFPETLVRTDLAILGAGNSCVEAAYLGVPTIAYVVNERNQLRFARNLRAENLVLAAVNLSTLETGLQEMMPQKVRQAMSDLSYSYMDGRGATRLAGLIVEVACA